MTIDQALDALRDLFIANNPGIDAVPVNEDSHEWIDWAKVRRADGLEFHLDHDLIPPEIAGALMAEPVATMAALVARRAASAQATAFATDILLAFQKMGERH